MRLTITLVAAVAAMLLFATPARAEWYFTKRGVHHLIRDAVERYYEDTEYHDVVPSCRPQNERYDPRFKYHRWVCAFTIRGDEYEYCDDPDHQVYGGRWLIIGSRGKGRYYRKVLNGLQCVDL